MKKTLLLLTISLFLTIQQKGNAQERYLDEIFTNVDVNSNVTYGNNITVFPILLGQSPSAQDLLMDIYTPNGDTVTNRPVVMIIHTGSFLPAILNGQATGSKTDNAVIAQCESFAKKGYVAVAISYRAGWNPTSTDSDVRRRGLIQAALRGLQDTRTAVRFLRKSNEEGNPYGISCQFAVGGIGTGGYVSLAAASLNDYATELTTPKFLDTSMDIDGDGVNDAIPYIIPEFLGNLDGTSVGILPELDLDGDGVTDATDVVLCTPNHIGYSSEIDMAFNIGGAIPDSAWIEQGEVPIASMQCYLDEDGPYEVGNIVVPTTNEVVIEGHGSLAVQRFATSLGNNDVFSGLSMNINDSWYNNGDGAANSALQVQAMTQFGQPATDDDGNPVWAFEGHDVYPGLFPIVSPKGDQLDESDDCVNCGQGASACLFPWSEQGSPWDWWNNDPTDPLGYPLAATQNPLAPPGTPAETYACLSTLGSPDMSEAKGLAFAEMIQEFITPRIYAALDLSNSTNSCNTDSTGLNIIDNQLKRSIIKTIDLTGREVNMNANKTVLIHIYNNGTVEKQYSIK
tara:strand:+ start:1586 stop:3289 length:1704 start_codon:yes stop_codon:yes gene_type:complete